MWPRSTGQWWVTQTVWKPDSSSSTSIRSSRPLTFSPPKRHSQRKLLPGKSLKRIATQLPSQLGCWQRRMRKHLYLLLITWPPTASSGTRRSTSWTRYGRTNSLKWLPTQWVSWLTPVNTSMRKSSEAV
jgi:hypothetical protein